MAANRLAVRQSAIRVLSYSARTEFQGLWRAVLTVAHVGMGLLNTDPSTNGEFRAIREWSLSRLCPQAPIVFDVGASDGDFAARFREINRQATVYCFEPSPTACERLRSRFVEDHHVFIHGVAASDETGTARLFDHRDTYGSQHATLLGGVIDGILGSDSSSAEVSTITLDHFALAQGIPRIDYLKIDVEGAEDRVLRGAHRLIQQQRVGVVHFEFNSHNAISGLSLLRINNSLLPFHRVFRIVRNGLVPVGRRNGLPYDATPEVFRYGNYVALPWPEAPGGQRVAEGG